jgi:uncharacterized protein YcbK (DUF882 family)
MPTIRKCSVPGLELNRRRFIQLGVFSALGLFSSFPGFAATQPSRKTEKFLSFYNTHTGQSLKIVYWADGMYLPGSLEKINDILRDHRTNEIKPIDTNLLDLLCAIRVNLKSRQPFHIISGYRSPKTNAILRRRSGGVAKNSLHVLGKAVDIRVPGCCLASLRQTATKLRIGGVGYYPRSNFVHVDVGPVRSW